jgi:hypothetical protein
MDFSDEYKEYLREVIVILKTNIEDLKQKKGFGDAEEQEYIAGRLFSYHEVIISLRATLAEFGISEAEIGLDKIKM